MDGREETPLIVQLIEEKKIRASKVMNRALARKLMEDFTIDAGKAEVLTRKKPFLSQLMTKTQEELVKC